MIKKRFPAEFKVLTDASGQPTGEVEFYASVFGNIDLIGDRVMPGAFSKSLKKWQKSGAPIPVVFSHTWDDPFAIIGAADPAKCVEDNIGLKIVAQFDIADNPTAAQVYRLMDRKVIREASFAFDVPKGGEKKASDGANNLNELDILEVGPCLKGMNPATGNAPVMTKSDPELASELRSLAEAVDGSRTKQAIAGSVEERQDALRSAVSKLLVKDDDPTAWAYITGTFDDHVIACVYSHNDPETYYSIPYTATDNRSVVLGTPTKVDVVQSVMQAKGFAWTDSDGNGHIPLDDEGQVRAALNLAQNDWTFRGNRMNPAPPAADRAGVIRRILAAASKFNIETSLEAPKDMDEDDVETKDASAATSEAEAGEAVEPDYTDKRPKSAEGVVWVNGQRYVPEGEKAGRRNSSADQERVQNMHDTAVALGAACSPGEDSSPTEEVEDHFGMAAEDGGHMDTKSDELKTAQTKDASDGEDDVDADGDRDASKPAEPEEEAEANAETKSADEETSTGTKSADEGAAEEPEGAKSADRQKQLSVEVDLLELENFLL